MTTEQQATTTDNPTAGTSADNAGGAATTGNAPQAGTGNTATTGADDLDALLKEFETPAASDTTKGAKPAAGDGTVTKDDLARVVQYVDGLTAEQQAAKVAADIKSAVETVKRNDALKHIPDEMVQEMLEGSAAKDARLREAWKQRHDKPEAWTKVLAGWASKKAEAFKSLADPKLTGDREALMAAVRGQGTTTAPQTPDWKTFNGMTDAQFRAWKEQQLAGA